MLTVIFAVFAFCFVLERVIPGWRLPKVRTWPLRVLAINGVQLIVVVVAGMTWERWLSTASLFHLSRHVGPAVGGLIAYFIATFVFYWWHRWRHETRPCCGAASTRFITAPQRLEVITSFYKHPGEMIVNSIIGSLLVYALLGLSAEAGAWYTLCTALGEFLLSHERAHAALGRIRLSTTRDAPNSPPVRPPQEQLRRHHVVGHALRHLRKSARVGRPLRV
jgi:sterol desaturase/sphingolipid hydroxylase (fatty acid hydroxylase superfamily)